MLKASAHHHDNPIRAIELLQSCTRYPHGTFRRRVLHSTVNSIKPVVGERRQHQRIPFRFKVKIVPYENGTCLDPIHVWTRDICPGGIGLIYHKRMREGKKFIIRLTRQDDTPILMLCTVRNCVELTANVFGIGASFAEVAESKYDAAAHGNDPSGVSSTFVESAFRCQELTEEVRRISEAILS